MYVDYMKLYMIYIYILVFVYIYVCSTHAKDSVNLSFQPGGILYSICF